jgi:hypothetical protein
MVWEKGPKKSIPTLEMPVDGIEAVFQEEDPSRDDPDCRCEIFT